MKLPCEMVQDLLPLYHDGVCSEVSSVLVGEHLKECGDCRKVLTDIDAEIEVPKMEVDAAKPLLSIQVNWNKQKRKTLLKCLGAGVAAFVLLFSVWFVTMQCTFIPVEPEAYIVRQTAQFADGHIYLETSNHYVGASPYITVTEDGALYETRKRTLFAEWEEERGGYGSISFDPETDTWENVNGEEVLITAYYLGEPGSKDAILLWEKGMEMTPASEELEEERRERERRWKEAFGDTVELTLPDDTEPTMAEE